MAEFLAEHEQLAHHGGAVRAAGIDRQLIGALLEGAAHKKYFPRLVETFALVPADRIKHGISKARKAQHLDALSVGSPEPLEHYALRGKGILFGHYQHRLAARRCERRHGVIEIPRGTAHRGRKNQSQHFIPPSNRFHIKIISHIPSFAIPYLVH